MDANFFDCNDDDEFNLPLDTLNLEDVNFLNEHGNTILHNAIIQNDWNMLKVLLQHPNIDVNLKSGRGETPLLMSLLRFQSDDFIMPLIKAGCDPNLPNKYKQTPLHIAMLRSSTNIALELIKRGANVNDVDVGCLSPLHYAVDNDNLEGVCMLLYYEADVIVLCKDSMTPFTYAIYLRRNDIAQELFYYYDDFTHADIDGYTALHLATRAASPLAFDLVNAGVNVNCCTYYYDESPLLFSTEYENCELFKLIWSKVDYKILLNCREPFLAAFVWKSPFTASEFLECLHLILNCAIGFDLLEELMKTNSFQSLLRSFHDFDIKLSDRMTVINICLSSGFNASIGDINSAYTFYGFGEELEAFIYCFSCDQEFALRKLATPILGFILGMKVFSTVKMSEIHYFILETYKKTKNTFDVFKYFSLPPYEKTQWKYYFKSNPKEDQEVFKEIELVAEIPSLLEMSRNKFYTFIHQANNIENPYQFHDAVKTLKIPPYVQDILRFKRPVY